MYNAAVKKVFLLKPGPYSVFYVMGKMVVGAVQNTIPQIIPKVGFATFHPTKQTTLQTLLW